MISSINAQYAMTIAKRRDFKPYGYGGVWVANNVNRTTDCSGIVTHMLDALTRGEAGMRWSRLGLSTEAYRYCGGNENNPRRGGAVGPFGTIRVVRPQDIPGDAALRIGLHHGPGGGAASHMACTLAGVAIESSGSYGQRVGGPARGYNHPYFHDWFYLPGPIQGGGPVTVPPVVAQPPGILYLSIGSTGPAVLRLQQRLNRDYPLYSDLEEDGEYGPATAGVVMIFQRRAGLTVDGVAGPATHAALGLPVSS